MSDFGRGAPISRGYEISRFEVRAFMAALGLNPVDVDSITIKDKRVIANPPRWGVDRDSDPREQG